jgi:predicted SnoaL-like aldol condensation-catalyzing enzyme
MENTLDKRKEIRIPGPDHPITISPVEGKVRVMVAGRIVAESERTLRLEEKGYPPVYYLPRNLSITRIQLQELNMPKTTPQQNKAIVLEAFDTLFNKRDYAAAERFWSPKYIQHSAHIAPGREGLFALVRATPDTLRYENQLIVAEGDYVIAHGRFTGMGRPAAWIAADVVRFEDGLLAEHWDVLQDEATQKESVSGLPMFGDSFPE